VHPARKAFWETALAVLGEVPPLVGLIRKNRVGKKSGTCSVHLYLSSDVIGTGWPPESQRNGVLGPATPAASPRPMVVGVFEACQGCLAKEAAQARARRQELLD